MTESRYYRPEIDGLRAIAVILVILFHADFALGGVHVFPGGYIGVDVFFVISGYLITSILYRDIRADRFSLTAFYERRARRILPALFVVLAVTSLAAWHYLLPDELVEYAYSLFSTVFFGANIYFWKYTGLYQAESSNLLPLLHMWSLAVEEQFYLLYPLIFFFFVTRLRRFVLPVLLVSTMASLALAQWASTHAFSANFYLMPTRAWELFCGAMLVFLEPYRGRPRPRPVTTLFMAAGLASIFFFAACCDKNTRHPSLITAIPIAGTMLILWFADARERVTGLLSSRPVVFVGLLSYSLYLWHQPVFVFTRMHLDRRLQLGEIGMVLVLVSVLSASTYFLVERRTRNRARTSNRAIWTIAASGAAAGVLAVGVLVSGRGVPSRFPATAQPLLKILEYRDGVSAVDGTSCAAFTPGESPCVFEGNPKGEFTLLTVGDSHIRTLDAPILERLPEMAFARDFVPLNLGGCLLVAGLDRINPDTGELFGYDRINEARIKTILGFKHPIVITGGRLPLQLETTRFDNTEGGVEEGDRAALVKLRGRRPERATLDDVAGAYRRTYARLLEQGVRIVLVYPVPEVGWNVPRKMLHRVKTAPERFAENLEEQPITTSYEVFRNRSAKAYDVYDRIGEHPNLVRVYPEAFLCGDGRCITHDRDIPLYRDDDHLSFVGGNLLLDRIVEKISRAWPTGSGAPQDKD